MRRNIDAANGLPASCTLDAVRQIKPVEQGSIDHLCGLYTVINALRLLTPKSPQRDRALFESGVAYLDEREWLSTVLTEGMPTRLFVGLARHLAKGHDLQIERVVASRKSDMPEQTIKSAIATGIPVLAAIDPPLDHYSVICGYSPTRWLLFDSYGYRWLNRRHCSFQRRPTASHRLSAWTLSAPTATNLKGSNNDTSICAATARFEAAVISG
jgi:hypothetical protein